MPFDPNIIILLYHEYTMKNIRLVIFAGKCYTLSRKTEITVLQLRNICYCARPQGVNSNIYITLKEVWL
ncbi:hypothetical protein GCM10008910_05040 [Faecalicatena orotica]|uniref:Uncharacterized protein n=1 Tax=Faecalicatena orotica TaxID=1544 RepID=A0A2Y9BAS1_9FIRM|nr:hypothetical protein A8806_103233 [Faecalicatena orotica]SSA54989.1 hypothetical protein SAMN05216536_103233 [Faecalicatena orotica]